MMMTSEKEKRPRLETPAEWQKFSRGRGKETEPGTALARVIGNRLQMVYPVNDLNEEPEDLQRLLAELTRKGL